MFAPAFGRRPRRRALAQALWTPLNLGPSLVAWWDATALPTLTLNGSGVSSWADRVSGRAATQSAVAAQLAYSATGLNGKPAVVGTGAQNLSISSVTGFPAGSSPDTTFTCYAPNQNKDNSVLISWGGHPSTNNQNYDERIHGFGNGAAYRPWATVLIDGDVYGNTGVQGRPTLCVSTNAGWADSKLLSMYQDGAATPNTKALSNAPITTLNYGNLFNFENPYCAMANAALGSVGVVNRVLTTSERQKLEGYLAWTFGIQANLPAAHPYSARAPYVSDP